MCEGDEVGALLGDPVGCGPEAVGVWLIEGESDGLADTVGTGVTVEGDSDGTSLGESEGDALKSMLINPSPAKASNHSIIALFESSSVGTDVSSAS
jgi:hypothetical protein